MGKKKVLSVLMAGMMVGTLLTGCQGAAKQGAANTPAAQETQAGGQSAGDTAQKEAAGAENHDQGGAQPEMVLRVAYDNAETESFYKGLVAFKDKVEKDTDGRIGVTIYPNAQLGSARDSIEGMSIGTVDCSYAATATLASFVPEFSVLDGPFLFKSEEQAHKVIDGEVGDSLKQKVQDNLNIRILSYMDVGYRYIYSKKEVDSLEKFKGLKIRTMDSDIPIRTFELLGTIPVPMAQSEIFTALQQGTIDAAENNCSFILNQKMYENAKYVIKSNQTFGFSVLMISDKLFSSMSEEDQKILTEAGLEASRVQREAGKEQNDDAEAKLKEEGVTFIELDNDELYQAVSPIYTEMKDLLIPELVEKIQAE